MTANQIAYWNLQENKRSNLANEQIRRDTVSETRRSNVINEGLKHFQNLEQHRSNVAREDETHRSNRANEKLIDRRIFAQNFKDISRGMKDVTDAVRNTVGSIGLIKGK